MRLPTYEPVGACGSCCYTELCHPARQRAMDQLGAGRHRECPFYAGHRAREARERRIHRRARAGLRAVGAFVIHLLNRS